MQVFNIKNEKYRVFFDEIETNNIIKTLGRDNISIRNVNLCAYIEKKLKKYSKGKRIMVLNVSIEEPYLVAIVLFQKIYKEFPQTKNNIFNNILKVTKVKFPNEKKLKDWEKKDNYNYKVLHIKGRRVKIAVFNMLQDDELKLSDYEAEIVSVTGLFEFIVTELKYKLATR